MEKRESRKLRHTCPDTKVVVAYTSHIIIDRVKANEGLEIPTPEEALAQLKAEGYSRVAMTSLDIIPGLEYDYKKAVFNLYKDNFKKVTFGTPLMYWQGQEDKDDDVAETMEALATQLPQGGKKDAILVMPKSFSPRALRTTLEVYNPTSISTSILT